MRQILLVSVILMGVSWAMAQSDQSQSTSPSQTTATQSTPTSGGGSTTVQGCLSGTDGNYTLTDKSGTAYQLTGDTAKLSEHVGHEIKVTGSTSAPAGGASASAGASQSAQSLQVSSVKHVSKTCQSGAMAK